MEGFLNNSPKFNNSLSDLLFLTFSIKTVSFRSFLLLQIAKTHCFQRFYNRSIFVTLFQLDMSIDIVFYKWHKINVFVIRFSLIIHFISVFLIFASILQAQFDIYTIQTTSLNRSCTTLSFNHFILQKFNLLLQSS